MKHFALIQVVLPQKNVDFSNKMSIGLNEQSSCFRTDLGSHPKREKPAIASQITKSPDVLHVKDTIIDAFIENFFLQEPSFQGINRVGQATIVVVFWKTPEIEIQEMMDAQCF